MCVCVCVCVCVCLCVCVNVQIWKKQGYQKIIFIAEYSVNR